MEMIWIVLVGGALLTGYLVRQSLRRARRERLRIQPFPATWAEILRRNVPIYEKLPSALRDKLHGLIQVFLAEKAFEGCGGLQLTDEIKLTIAAQACLLLLSDRSDCYPRLQSVLVYPGTYVVPAQSRLGRHPSGSPRQTRMGESWRTGAVVLSWDNVQHGTAIVNDGQNLVLHEFAHQLDQEFSGADGLPALEQSSRYVAWARILGVEYEKLRQRTEHGAKTLLNPYGATNPAEFFAVATEAFFEKPWQMKLKCPELYEELKSYYGLDPAEWT